MQSVFLSSFSNIKTAVLINFVDRIESQFYQNVSLNYVNRTESQFYQNVSLDFTDHTLLNQLYQKVGLDLIIST